MPQMGVSVAEGTIVEWTKRPGDWVEADETVCMVTTDKVDVEIPSPGSGRLARVLVDEGATVSVGTPLAELDTSARPGEAHPEEHHENERGETAAAEAAEPELERPPAASEVDGSDEVDRSRFYSPVVRRIADKHGVDLERVQGTGIGGRVRKRDVLAQIESGGAEGAETGPQPEPAERPLHIESPYIREAGPEAAAPPAGNGDAREPAAPASTGSSETTAGERREPMSIMRQRIAEHMVESRRSAAHCTTIVEADLSRVVAARRELKEEMGRRGVPLTYLAFVAAATVAELQRHPIMNASIDGSDIVYHDDVNLGIAVALDQGLIVPVIQRAQRHSLEGLAAEIGDLADRARSGRLEPDDVHGGTFTITNPGQFGAVLATPIINQPQVAILDLEAVVKRPVVVDGPEGDAISIRPMTYLCMSWDHRALDGAQAARFLAGVKGRLEGWEER
jgi:2-oxoglutarate dehydrogenase E2 component (dihydrolipoamide succinyltransferase)